VRLGLLLVALAIVSAADAASGQITGDAMGKHNFAPTGISPVKGARPESCAYCHAPHSGLNAGLWNQKLTKQIYSTYSSATEKNTGTQPTLGGVSNHCLSCHDGTVAMGSTVVYGQVTTHGSMYSQDIFGANMQTTHPYSMVLPLKDSIDLYASLAANHRTNDPTGAVTLVNNNVECTSCHDPHVEAKDPIALNFLVENSANGQLCLACHNPNRKISSQVNPIADWSTGAHALSTAKISLSASLGGYPTVSANACESCHAEHNTAAGSHLLRGANEQDCIGCHNGSNVSPMPAYADVFAEYASPKIGHPFPTSNNPHDAAESVLLNNNRHATCVDCHNAHGSQIVGTFTASPLIRISQRNTKGISATDGTTVLTPAVNQFENCLRCHGASAGKQVLPIYGYFPNRAVSGGDQLNLIPQFAVTASSSHPVMHVSNSVLAQPSLRTRMLQIDGITLGRAMGTRIFCTDCHNSDDNREFGGTGSNGPHGSKWTHILERRYEFSQTAMPGGLINNLFPTPDLTVTGPYAMCDKCHNLSTQVVKNSSWKYHSTHINTGFSCSVCHTAHGMGATSATITGERLINFDANVVAPNNGQPVSYNHATNSCVLVCHQAAHNANGTVTTIGVRAGFSTHK
jgi:predicted CXXCH cytochrome family protein